MTSDGTNLTVSTISNPYEGLKLTGISPTLNLIEAFQLLVIPMRD